MKFLPALIFLMSFSSVFAQQNIHIQGTVTGAPGNQALSGAKVVAVRAYDDMRIDSVYTNSNGYY